MEENISEEKKKSLNLEIWGDGELIEKEIIESLPPQTKQLQEQPKEVEKTKPSPVKPEVNKKKSNKKKDNFVPKSNSIFYDDEIYYDDPDYFDNEDYIKK